MPRKKRLQRGLDDVFGIESRGETAGHFAFDEGAQFLAETLVDQLGGGHRALVELHEEAGGEIRFRHFGSLLKRVIGIVFGLAFVEDTPFLNGHLGFPERGSVHFVNHFIYTNVMHFVTLEDGDIEDEGG